MKTYIEREALRAEALRLTKQMEFSFENCFPYWQFSKSIKEAPAADVAEVVHGRWLPTDMGGGEPDEAYRCSNCQEPWFLESGTPADNNMNFCPTCGARMDKEDGEA